MQEECNHAFAMPKKRECTMLATIAFLIEQKRVEMKNSNRKMCYIVCANERKKMQ